MKIKQLNKRIVFMGGGKMAEALISGFVKSGLVKPAMITAVDIDAKRLRALKNIYKIRVSADKIAPLISADIVLLAVKPQQMEGLLVEIGHRLKKAQLVVSIAAGITTKWIEYHLPVGTPVIRTMPNTPAALGHGATGIAKGKYAGNAHIKTVKILFDKVGKTAVMKEDLINSVTAVSGSGPAYVFFFTELLEDAALKLGLDKQTAREFSRRTVLGAGQMLETFKGIDASVLRRNVTSPGGTTEAAVKVLENSDFRDIFLKAAKRARERSIELSK